eukprot:COSAG02_NODE_23544_length_715_cov_1.258117_2_plen_112_part_01
MLSLGGHAMACANEGNGRLDGMVGCCMIVRPRWQPARKHTHARTHARTHTDDDDDDDRDSARVRTDSRPELVRLGTAARRPRVQTTDWHCQRAPGGEPRRATARGRIYTARR